MRTRLINYFFGIYHKPAIPEGNQNWIRFPENIPIEKAFELLYRNALSNPNNKSVPIPSYASPEYAKAAKVPGQCLQQCTTWERLKGGQPSDIKCYTDYAMDTPMKINFRTYPYLHRSGYDRVYGEGAMQTALNNFIHQVDEVVNEATKGVN